MHILSYKNQKEKKGIVPSLVKFKLAIKNIMLEGLYFIINILWSKASTVLRGKFIAIYLSGNEKC